ncbi:MAG: calcium-binding protein, partial [Trichodesmium sp. MO_231.B1]|nr:calcium-binding protein [Trichodesmium sp. MO_231.B1]
MEINGTNSSETLNGGVENDSIQGFGGNDSLFGGAGNDSLTGGIGNDLFNGGAGADIFVYERISGTNTIVDFEQGVDRIDVSSLGINDFQILQGLISDNIDGDAVLSSFFNGATANLVIRGVTTSQLTAQDFILNDSNTDDEVNGTGSSDQLFGGTGNDSIQGSGGNDQLFGGAGNDSLTGGTG